MGPVVVWPAPALPAIIQDNERRLTLVVAHMKGEHNIIPWAQSLALRSSHGGTRVTTNLNSIKSISRNDLGAFVKAYAEICDTKGLSFAEVQLRATAALEPIPPKTVQLYDLVAHDDVVRASSIAAFANGQRLRVAFVSDLQFGHIWNEIAQAAHRFAPDIASKMVHPNRQLRLFIDEANSLLDHGDLDLVVFGGDLVDHVHRDGRKRVSTAANDTNVLRLADSLAKLRVPVFAIPGNHDFRLFPWRPRLYGLQMLGIPRRRARALLRAAGLWDLWPLLPCDLDALKTEDAGKVALVHHLRHPTFRTSQG